MQTPENTQPQFMALILTCRNSPPERLRSATAEVQKHFPEIPMQVIDGLIADDDDVDQLFDRTRARIWSKRSPTREEIATYGTHRLAWRYLIDSGQQAAVIFEDDFAVHDPDCVRSTLSAVSEMFRRNIDVLKLFDFPRDRKNNFAIVSEIDGLPIAKWHTPRAGMVGYVITLKGAERFLARSRVFRVVDEDIKYYWELGLNIWSTLQKPIVDQSAQLGGSLLEPARLAERKNRNLLRSLHGALIAAHRKVRNKIAFSAAVKADQGNFVRKVD